MVGRGFALRHDVPLSPILQAWDLVGPSASMCSLRRRLPTRTADEERTKALDPAVSPDPKAARQAMEDAAFARDRLKTLLPRLETRYREIAEAEALAAWRAEADELEPRGVALLDGFAEFYPEMSKRIAKHLDDMRAFDKQVDDLNRRLPNGVHALSHSTPALGEGLAHPFALHDGRVVVAAAAAEPGAPVPREHAAGPVHRQRSGGGGLSGRAQPPHAGGQATPDRGGGEGDARPRGARSRRSPQGTRGRPGSLLRRAWLADVMENFAPEAFVSPSRMSAVDRVGRQARSSARRSRPRDVMGCGVRFRQLRTYRRVLPGAAVCQRPTFGPVYSITSSAATCRVSGTLRLSVFAVLRLMTSSNRADCVTGRSAGLSPLRIRPI